MSLNNGASEDTGLLPDFCDVRVLFMVVLIVELLALMLAMASPASKTAFWDTMGFLSLMMQWLGLMNAAVLCGLRKQLNLKPVKVALGVSFGLMMLVSLAIGLALIFLLDFLALSTFMAPLGDYFLLRFMVVSALIYGVVLRYFYIQQQWRLNHKAQFRAEIQALRARIRPHFLFNSMNTIASLISSKPESAEKAVVDLSDLFRASLQEKDRHTLGDELSLTNSYLDIEVLRLGSRLRVRWDIDNSLKDEEIPSLCLQPLAENAIYHGIEPIPEGGEITISATKQDDALILSVKNPTGDSSTPHKHHGNHMAQDNIKRRLKLVYGEQAEFTTNATKGDYLVSLKIPLDMSL